MDSLADRDPITELICHFREALKGGDYTALSTVGFRVDETSMLAPDGWTWQSRQAKHPRPPGAESEISRKLRHQLPGLSQSCW